MSDFLKILTRKNSLRKEVQSLTASELEKVVSDLRDILESRKAEVSALAAKKEAKAAAIAQIQDKLAELGLTADDLAGLDIPKKAVKAKYRITDEAGKVHEWSGRGRTPLVFQQQFDQGASKEDFRID